MFGYLCYRLVLMVSTVLMLSDSLVSCNDQQVKINLKKPLHTVAEEFVSFAIRATDLRQLEDEAE